MPSVLFLMGPTAVGKTELAVSLRRRLPLELVSVDSSMVYRGLDIGAGKPALELLRQAPHRLLDIRDPEQPYSAADFCREAMAEIKAIHGQGRIPLLVGGTGLYFRALRNGLAPLPSADAKIRARLAAEASNCGWDVLHQRLREVDPVAAERIRPTDSQRIQRALEVYELSGEPISVLQAKASMTACPYPIQTLILECHSRAWLHQRIEQRFLAMLEQGLVEEVRELRTRLGAASTLPALRAVGYRQVLGYLNGDYDYPQMIAKAVAATRQLARRQLTWLRKEPADQRLYADAGDIVQGAYHWAGRAC